VVPLGRGIDTSAFRQNGDLTGQGCRRRLECARHLHRCGDRVLKSPPWKLNRSGLRPRLESEGHSTRVRRSTRQASAIFAGRSISDPSSFMSHFERGATPRPATNFGQICKRSKQRDCKSRPFGVRRFKSVLCPPLCGHGLRVESLVANERVGVRISLSHQSRPCSSVVERRFEEPRVRGSIPLSGANKINDSGDFSQRFHVAHVASNSPVFSMTESVENNWTRHGCDMARARNVAPGVRFFKRGAGVTAMISWPKPAAGAIRRGKSLRVRLRDRPRPLLTSVSDPARNFRGESYLNSPLQTPSEAQDCFRFESRDDTAFVSQTNDEIESRTLLSDQRRRPDCLEKDCRRCQL
jgi:hypothetical protein